MLAWLLPVLVLLSSDQTLNPSRLQRGQWAHETVYSRAWVRFVKIKIASQTEGPSKYFRILGMLKDRPTGGSPKNPEPYISAEAMYPRSGLTLCSSRSDEWACRWVMLAAVATMMSTCKDMPRIRNWAFNQPWKDMQLCSQKEAGLECLHDATKMLLRCALRLGQTNAAKTVEALWLHIERRRLVAFRTGSMGFEQRLCVLWIRLTRQSLSCGVGEAASLVFFL